MTFALQVVFHTTNPKVQQEVLTDAFHDKMIEAFQEAFKEIDSELVGLRVKEMPSEDKEMKFWCIVHDRMATHKNNREEPCCDPKLAGITLPCKVVIYVPIPKGTNERR